VSVTKYAWVDTQTLLNPLPTVHRIPKGQSLDHGLRVACGRLYWWKEGYGFIGAYIRAEHVDAIGRWCKNCFPERWAT
jgi:hypothetical protein